MALFACYSPKKQDEYWRTCVRKLFVICRLMLAGRGQLLWIIAMFAALEQIKCSMSNISSQAARTGKASQWREEKRLMLLAHPQSL